MMIAYAALETFDPSWGETWMNYIKCSGLDHLNEVVSLDQMLCPSVIQDLTDEDWNHISSEPWFGLFQDLDYLLGRVEAEDRYQIIEVLREPSQSDILGFTDERFKFKGYDLVEQQAGNSALTNCFGFDLACSADDLSECGLVSDHAKAYQIRDLLKQHYPDEHHADCTVWAIWRMRDDHGMLLNRKKLSDFFRASPLAAVELDLTRDSSPARDDMTLPDR
jgi:hypothetical protein